MAYILQASVHKLKMVVEAMAEIPEWPWTWMGVHSTINQMLNYMSVIKWSSMIINEPKYGWGGEGGAVEF